MVARCHPWPILTLTLCKCPVILTAMNFACTVCALPFTLGQPELSRTVELRFIPSHLHGLKCGGNPPENHSEASAKMCGSPLVDWLAVGSWASAVIKAPSCLLLEDTLTRP